MKTADNYQSPAILSNLLMEVDGSVLSQSDRANFNGDGDNNGTNPIDNSGHNWDDGGYNFEWD